MNAPSIEMRREWLPEEVDWADTLRLHIRRVAMLEHLRGALEEHFADLNRSPEKEAEAERLYACVA